MQSILDYRFSRLMLCILLCFVSGSAFADPCSDENNIVRNNGECWRTLQPLEKSAIIRGIWIGKSVRSLSLEMSAQSGFIYFGMDWASTPEATSIGDIEEYFDRLYKTPVNRKIEWQYAYLLAALMARDDDENDRLSLLTFLRSNASLPTEGTLVGVKAPNVVTIEFNNQRYDVRLNGIKVAEKESENAKAFLDGLRSATWGPDCASAVPTPVTLYYRTELFDSDGRLAADVRINSIYKICLKGKPISIAGEGASFTNLGYFLLRNGLADFDSRVDPKWSEARKQTLWNDSAANEAKEERLYQYGDGTNPLVEMVSGRVPPDTY